MVAEDEANKTFTINRVHVRPGKPFAFGQEANKWANCLSNVPSIQYRPGNYSPMPYTFRLPPAPKPTKIGKVEARCPPYYLLVDHTIAVVWMIWSANNPDVSPLGCTQLHWALAFLKTIYNRRGEHPADIERCIDRIEDMLFDEYAKLHEENTKLEKMNESFRYADGAVFSKSIITPNLPFSINYNKMVNILGEGVGQALETVSSISSADAEERLISLKKRAGVGSIQYLDEQFKKNAVEVLKAWHAKQTKRIMQDMRKLKNIENKIRHVDEGDFPFLSPEQMNTLMQALDEDDEDEAEEAHHSGTE